MDEVFSILPEEELNNTYLIFETLGKATTANQRITENMQLPPDSQTNTWCPPMMIINGQYANMFCIKKPDEGNPEMMDGVVVEIEAEYDPIWFEETE